MHTFQAHDSAIKALALDPCEEYFTTGSAEGNIKVSHHMRDVQACYYVYLLSRLIGKGNQSKKLTTLFVRTLSLASFLLSVWFLLGPRKPDELSILSGHKNL